MMNRQKIEQIVLAAIMIGYFLLLKDFFSSLFYITAILSASVYFFPIKLFLVKEKSNLWFLAGSGFLISSSLIFSYLSYTIEEMPDNFKFIILLLICANLFLLYRFVQKNLAEKYLHLILMFIICMTFFR